MITLIVLALAELQTVRRTDRLTTMFLLDVSNSMPARAAEGGARLRHRGVEEAAAGRPGRRDRLRQGAAGRGPAGPERAQPAGRSRARSTPRTPTWARPSSWRWRRFPEDTARRIVVLSDGNENRGNLLEQALTAKSLGVQVDVAADRVLLRPRGPGREGRRSRPTSRRARRSTSTS